eukprot:6211819-Pleurochrysis_carterae.AAC.7
MWLAARLPLSQHTAGRSAAPRERGEGFASEDRIKAALARRLQSSAALCCRVAAPAHRALLWHDAAGAGRPSVP